VKVLLIGNYTADGQYSMQGFSGVLLEGLRERGIDVRISAPVMRLGHLGTSHPGLGKWLGYTDKYLLYPPELRRAAAWADIVHVCDQGSAMYMRHLQSVPHLLTCHDVLAIRAARGELPEQHTGRSGKIYQDLIFQGLTQVKHLACVSEATRSDALRLTHLLPGCTRLIPNGLYQSYAPMPDAQSIGLLEEIGLSPSHRFLLHVGGNQFYKNRLMVLQIFHALRRQDSTPDLKLVLAGKPITTAMQEYINQNSLADTVLTRTGLSNTHLRALYSRADGLVFPSLYEGFGLPVIEAQACGCPVFTSNRAPLTEIGGDAAVYFDPTQPEDAARTIAAHLGEKEARAAAGLENAQRFTRETMLDRYVQAYKDILDGTFCTIP
jgi:glycosyltransferase involved in cell wall biosynthesis